MIMNNINLSTTIRTPSLQIESVDYIEIYVANLYQAA